MYEENKKTLLYAFTYISVAYALLHAILAYCRAAFSGIPILNDFAILLVQFNVQVLFFFLALSMFINREKHALNDRDVKRNTLIYTCVLIVVLSIASMLLQEKTFVNAIIFREIILMAGILACLSLVSIALFSSEILLPGPSPLNKEKIRESAYIQVVLLIIAIIFSILLYSYRGVFDDNSLLESIAYLFIIFTLIFVFFGVPMLNIIARVRLNEINDFYLRLFFALFLVTAMACGAQIFIKILA